MAAKNMPEKTKGVPVDIGIGEAERREIAEGLARVVADTFTLYLMTHNFHWNVTGPLFPQLHALFEEQYTELWKATDELAERVRALGFPVPATLGQFTRLTSIPQKDEMPAAEEMIRLLAQGHQAVIRTIRSVFAAPERSSDQATVDLLTERLGSHEKAAWMLRSTLA